MIIEKEINPDKNIYYISSLIIEALFEGNKLEYDYLELFSVLNKQGKKISLNLYSLSLNWLFIMGIIENEKGSIKKCF